MSYGDYPNFGDNGSCLLEEHVTYYEVQCIIVENRVVSSLVVIW
jgi:hypothetical protein